LLFEGLVIFVRLSHDDAKTGHIVVRIQNFATILLIVDLNQDISSIFGAIKYLYLICFAIPLQDRQLNGFIDLYFLALNKFLAFFEFESLQDDDKDFLETDLAPSISKVILIKLFIPGDALVHDELLALGISHHDEFGLLQLREVEQAMQPILGTEQWRVHIRSPSVVQQVL
jgi:hypothetical protein